MSIIFNQTGSSLVLALIVTFMLITLVTIVVHFSNTELKSAQKQERQTSAYYIAEAGVERAIYEINQSLQNDGVPPPQLSDSNFKGGAYEVTITPKTNGPDYNENIGYTIESIGTYEQEEEKISKWVRQPIGPPNPTPDGEKPSPFNFAVYAYENAKISSLLNGIKVDGDIHANDNVMLSGNTDVTNGSSVSSTYLNNINVNGAIEKTTYEPIPQPQFDFDYAREQAKKNGFYISLKNNANISLLGLAPTDKVIFIDGNLTQIGLDLLGIALQDRTIIVNGNFTGALELGGNSKLNLIVSKDINFLGLITGLQVNGILYAQGDIKTDGYIKVDGYMGAKNIDCGSGLLSGLLGLITGDMKFTYDSSVFNSLPSGIGFKKMYVEVVE